jgi:translation initiation factor 1
LRDGVLEIQGDHVDRVLQALEARGLKAKRAGG